MISIKLADGFTEITPHVAMLNGRVHVVTAGESVHWRAFTRDGGLEWEEYTPWRGWYPVTDGTCCWYHTESEYRLWHDNDIQILPDINLTQGAVGNSPLAVTPFGFLLYQDLGTGVYQESGVRVGNWKPTGIMRATEDGLPIMDDDSRRLWPYASGLCDEFGGVRVSEGKSGIEGEVNGVRYTLWHGRDTMRPRVAVEDDLVGITAYGKDGCWLWIGTKSELASLGTYNPVPPVPVPPVPPEVPVQHIDTVARECAKYGTPLGYEGAWKVINAVALTHADEGWGLVDKPGGTNWLGYSTDVILNRVTGEAADILGSSETLGIPVWNVLSPKDTPSMSRWRPPVGAVEPPEPPPVPPPVPPPSDVEARLLRVENFLKLTFKTW